jgi:hypothetical protein
MRKLLLAVCVVALSGCAATPPSWYTPQNVAAKLHQMHAQTRIRVIQQAQSLGY